MRLAICAGPSTTGKTSVLRHLITDLIAKGSRPAFLKIDVQYAEEDELLAAEFGIPTRKVYSGELCPDHCNVMVLGDALNGRQSRLRRAARRDSRAVLRCSPYVDGGLGIIVLEATSGMNLPRKVGPMLTLADVVVVTKIDRVSQAEREVFRARIQDAAPTVRIREMNALTESVSPPSRHSRGYARHTRSPPAARQSAGRNLHDLCGQEGDRLAIALRRRPRPRQRHVLSRRVRTGGRAHLSRQRCDDAASAACRRGDAAMGLLELRQSLQHARRWAAGARRRPTRPAGRSPRLIGAEHDEIVFTASGTEADNFALVGVAETFAAGDCHMVTSAIEHPAVLRNCRISDSARRRGYAACPSAREGIVEPRRPAGGAAPEHAACVGDGGQQCRRHGAAGARARDGSRMSTARCFTPTRFRLRASCRSTFAPTRSTCCRCRRTSCMARRASARCSSGAASRSSR